MIFVEDQAIKVGGVVLPGVVKKIEVKETAKIDEQEVKGSASKPKQATGYEDAKINIELIIDDTPSQTKYQRLAVIRNIFRKPGQSVPQPMDIINEDTAAHGVSKVLFKGLSHSKENKRGQLPVTLEFWEYVPQVITTKKSGSTAKKDGGTKNASSGSSSGTTLTTDYSSYLSKSRGSSPKSGGSPTVDDAGASSALNRVSQMPY